MKDTTGQHEEDGHHHQHEGHSHGAPILLTNVNRAFPSGANVPFQSPNILKKC